MLKSNFLKFIIIFITLTMAYFARITAETFPIFIDFTTIILPLAKVKSLQEYIQAITNLKIYDLQPLRDIYTFILLSLFKHFKFNSFLFGGIILLSLNILIIYNIFTLRTKNYLYALFPTTLIFFHPSYHHTILSLTQIKHLMASVFSVLTIYFWLKSQSNDNKALINKKFYISTLICSLMSHPIFIFFPLFLCFHDVFVNKRKIKNTLFANFFPLFVSFTWGIGNIIYYKYFLHVSLGTANVAGTAFSAEDLLQIGRGFSQSILPISIGTVFHAGNKLNLIGLLLLVLFLYSGYKVFKGLRNKFFSWFVLCMLVQLTYLINLKFFYLTDYYLLIPCCLYFLMTFELLNKLSSSHPLIIRNTSFALFISLLCLNIYKTYEIYKATVGQVEYYKYSYYNEGGCYNRNFYVNAISIKKKFDKLKEFAPIHMNESCYLATFRNWQNMVVVMNYMVLMREDITNEEKITYFEKKPKTPSNQYAEITLLASLNSKNTEKKLLELYHLLKEHHDDKNIGLMLKDGYMHKVIEKYCITSQKEICAKYNNLIKNTQVPPIKKSSEALYDLLWDKELNIHVLD